MINSNNSARRGNSTVSSQDAPSLPQCLPLEPITLGNQRFTRSGELRRVLGVPIGSNSEVNSFGVGRSKPTTPVATEELRNFKESVQDTSKKARCRAKVLGQSISKLDEYREVLGSVKRQRTDLLSNGRSGGGNSAMGAQILRTPHDQSIQRSEDKANNKTTGLGPKTRIRTSMLDARTDGRVAAAPRQQIVTLKDRENTHKVGDVQIEEKVRRLPVGGSGWDKKMKRKRSMGTVGSRALNGSRDIKRATLVKPSDDSELRSVDAQGFRSRASSGISVIKLVESSIPTDSSSRSTLKNELESISPLRDRTSLIDETLVGNGNIKSNIHVQSPAGSPISVKKSKICRTAKTSGVSMLDSSPHTHTFGDPMTLKEELNEPTNRNKSPALGVEDNQKRPISSTSSSAHHVAQWVGQRPLKISRPRRSNLAFPLSNVNEAQTSTQGLPPSDLSAGTPSVLSENEEWRGSQIKFKENGTDAGYVAVNGDHKDRNFIYHPRKNKVLVNREAGGKIENLPVSKPLQSSRRIPDKNRSKSGRRPSKKLTDHKAAVRAGPVLNCGSADFTGESDDRDELLAAAKYARNARILACSSPFWKKMEYYFASITSQDASYLKDQLNLAEELNGNLSQMLDDEYNALSVLMNKENSNNKSVKNKAPSLYQRLLSALIEEDENEEPYLHSEVRNISFQSASDDSHCGSCNPIDIEPRERDKVESEVESDVDLHSHKQFLDRNSCNKSASSNTNGSLSNNEQWQADDGLSYSSQVDGCAVSTFDHQYEMMSLDDRLLMELQSIGLCPVIMPHLEEREELNQDIIELQATLFQQVGTMRKHLGKIDEAIPDARDAERRNMEQLALNQLIEMAYKRRMPFRGSESSKPVVRRVSKQVGSAFTKRTLARCRKFEDTGRSCFAEPAIQDVLFSAPPSRNSNRHDSHIDNKLKIQHEPVLNQGRRKEMLLHDVISNGKNGNVMVNNRLNAMPKQKAKGNEARTIFVGTTHPTGPFNRGSSQMVDKRREEEEPVDFENGLGSVDLGGPQGIAGEGDLSSLLDFEEEGLQDDDCVGLEIPMDDLTDLQMLM